MYMLPVPVAARVINEVGQPAHVHRHVHRGKGIVSAADAQDEVGVVRGDTFSVPAPVTFSAVGTAVDEVGFVPTRNTSETFKLWPAQY